MSALLSALSASTAAIKGNANGSINGGRSAVANNGPSAHPLRSNHRATLGRGNAAAAKPVKRGVYAAGGVDSGNDAVSRGGTLVAFSGNEIHNQLPRRNIFQVSRVSFTQQQRVEQARRRGHSAGACPRGYARGGRRGGVSGAMAESRVGWRTRYLARLACPCPRALRRGVAIPPTSTLPPDGQDLSRTPPQRKKTDYFSKIPPTHSSRRWVRATRLPPFQPRSR